MSFIEEVEDKSNFLSLYTNPELAKAMQEQGNVSQSELDAKIKALNEKTKAELEQNQFKRKDLSKTPILSDYAKQRMEEYDRRMEKGWWGKLGTPAKIGIIGGGVLALSVITYLIVKK